MRAGESSERLHYYSCTPRLMCQPSRPPWGKGTDGMAPGSNRTVQCGIRTKKTNHRSRQPRWEWASALQGEGAEGQHRSIKWSTDTQEQNHAAKHVLDA